jgi:hypothetical protein
VVQATLGLAGAPQIDHYHCVAARGKVAGQPDGRAVDVAGLGQDPGALPVGQGAVVGAGLQNRRVRPILRRASYLDVDRDAVPHGDEQRLLDHLTGVNRLGKVGHLGVVEGLGGLGLNGRRQAKEEAESKPRHQQPLLGGSEGSATAMRQVRDLEEQPTATDQV